MGRENNEYLTSGSAATEGDYWSAGVRLSPSQRTSILLKGGHRYFGNTGLVNITHRTRFTNWLISYEEDITNRSLVELENQIVEIPSAAEGEGTEFGLISLPVLSTEAIIRETITAGFNLKYRKLSGGLKVARAQYDYQKSSSDEDVNTAELSVIWSYSPHTDIGFIGRTIRNEQILTDNSQRTSLLITSIGSDISRKAKIKAEYRKLVHDTNNGVNDYAQDIYMLGVEAKF